MQTLSTTRVSYKPATAQQAAAWHAAIAAINCGGLCNTPYLGFLHPNVSAAAPMARALANRAITPLGALLVSWYVGYATGNTGVPLGCVPRALQRAARAAANCVGM